jgi:RNA polymerase sigma factor (TIGR02999 family)
MWQQLHHAGRPRPQQRQVAGLVPAGRLGQHRHMTPQAARHPAAEPHATPLAEAPTPSLEITQWLAQLGAGTPGAGEGEAAEQVYSLLYQDLHRAARAHMRREADGHTLGPTALVHEAWFRLAEQTRTQWKNRSHFLAMASTMMRRILVDHALARRAAKRDAQLEPLDTSLPQHHGAALDLALDRDVVAVHEALFALQAHDARAARVVELKFFGGLEIEEIAEALAISPATVKRDWTLARAWLRRELGGAGAG